MTADASSSNQTDAVRLRYRRYALFTLYILSASSGVASVAVHDSSLLDVTSTVAFAVTATLWFSLDRRILGKPEVWIFQHLFFFAWPLAFLIHLTTSRGARGMAYWLLHGIGLLGTVLLASFLAALALYLMAWSS